MHSEFAIVVAALCALVACGGDNLTHPPARTPYQTPDEEPLPCLPDLDGRIVAHELAPTLDQAASYIVSPALPVDASEGFDIDVVGSVDPRGRRVWDWSTLAPSDQVAALTARRLDDQWYAEHFPDGKFSMPTDPGGRVDAIYSHGEDALLLCGAASAEPDPSEGRTLMVYEEPVPFFSFPLALGDRWSQTGVVRSGTLKGLSPWSQDDLYEVEVAAAGELRLPDFTFEQALRVDTRLTVRPKAGTKKGYVVRQVSFVFECFGEVARATSLLSEGPDDDPGPDFDEAREVRRLGWF